MKIVNSTTVVKCDIPNCQNTANYIITDDGIDERNQFNLCAECATKLHDILSVTVVPKSPENFIKKACKKKEAATIRENRYE